MRNRKQAKGKWSTQAIAVIAMLAAAGYALRFLEIKAPFSPPWLKIDFSLVPAMLGGFLYGPVAGMLIDGVKEGLHVITSTSGGVGELANVIMECALIIPASLFYRRAHFRGRTIVGCAIGCVLMGGAGALINYYVLFPLYAQFMPLPAILSAYQTLFPFIDSLWQAVLIHAMPFNIVKGLLISVVTVWLTKPLRMLLTPRSMRTRPTGQLQGAAQGGGENGAQQGR